MKTYFVISDIHSYGTEMILALKQAGFKKTNKDHILIFCGDLFDRGFESELVYTYLKKIPKNRRILIRGNHELLYLELLNKAFPDTFDFSNGTVRTFCSLANIPEEYLYYSYWFEKNPNLSMDEISQKVYAIWSDIRMTISKLDVTLWLQSNEWVNYYELNNFIFVHSFIPLTLDKKTFPKPIKYWPAYNISLSSIKYNADWRQASDIEWEDATWGCPWKFFKEGFFDKEISQNKTLVCGHWHTSDFHKNFEGIENDYSIFFSKNLIGLDACTTVTKEVNVLIIRDNKCYDKFNNELKEKGRN